ncbi:MAG: P-type conjugative transfer protein VirB9 [Rickettsiales bacterium]|nr:P-type conjugative transfer protein VirB9 [Rickettsiales bacterium]
MMRLFTLSLLLSGLFLLSPSAADALKSPRPQGVDGRIHTIMYAPDEVFKFTGHYGYQSSILLDVGEEIQTISMGDSVPWQITPSGNRIFLKPVEQDAQTNMTLLTNKRTYLFELHAEEAESIEDPNLIWVMKFIYPTQTFVSKKKKKEKLRKPEIDGYENFNFNYSIRGSQIFAPVKIYDDGEFTYFEFRDKNASIPAFYHVDAQNNEALINFRARGDKIIVERVSSRFTLRHGNEIVCVYNEALARSSRQTPPQMR